MRDEELENEEEDAGENSTPATKTMRNTNPERIREGVQKDPLGIIHQS